MSTHNSTNQPQELQPAFVPVCDAVRQAYEENLEHDSNELENIIITEKTQEWLPIPPNDPLQPHNLPSPFHLISKPIHTLATTHRYPLCSLDDLSDEELSVTMDPGEAANNALKVAIARHDYASVTSLARGQLHRFRTVLAQTQILRAAHYERLHEEDLMQEQCLIENYGEELARVCTNSVAAELTMDTL
ncbi:hypothetical protein M422DRAFT_256166 [Sphaerobolus stellatus SS14]|uniref:Uncharacterized protein n=1 Tax=Sphaerobolus stellatus (strain SS14) TaxID=990650 RepID=A0A0C9VR14_SPHS4|nr:hypothetical protein M422DRAFT_256166 [Sphaerobolus stellatus SS14]